MNFFSERFGLEVIVTDHALARARERAIVDTDLKDVIETGTAKYRDSKRLWIYKEVTGRTDNLICAAVVLDGRLVVKTVMINWELLE
jgi:hypothetical protein